MAGTAVITATAGCLGVVSGATEYEACPPLVALYPVLDVEIRDEVEHSTTVTAVGVGVRAQVELERFGLSQTVDVISWGTMATVHTVVPWEEAGGYLYVPQTIAALATPDLSFLGRDLNPGRDVTVDQVGDAFVESLTTPGTWDDARPGNHRTDRLRIVDIQAATARDIFDAFQAATPHWIPGETLATTVEYTNPWPTTGVEWTGEPVEARGRASLTDREYVVQYAETDLSFVTRLLESEGLTYFFCMEPREEVLILEEEPSSEGSLEDPDRFTPVGTAHAAAVERLAPHFATARISESVRELRPGHPVLLHRIDDCRGEAEADVSDYTTHADDHSSLLEFMLRY